MVGFQGDVPLVGRGRELTVLHDAVTSAAGGNPGAVLVAGEAGVGKSRLVRALLDDLPTEALVLRAQCVDLGDPGLPYLALLDLLRAVQAVAGADPEVAAALERFPVVAGMTDPDASHAVDESRRLQLFDAMAALLGDTGRIRGPVVVTVEDLQWVDSSSAGFLRFLLSRMLSERLVVVATVRTDGLATRPGARTLIAELGRLPLVRRLELQPFDEPEVAEYLVRVNATDDPGIANEVFRRTAGNPYYVQTLAAGLEGSGRLDDGVPRALADVLVGKVDALPEHARTVVRCAAIVTRPVSDRLLRQVAGLADADLDDALRLAVAEGVLTPEGPGYVFAHDLLRRAVYDDLLPGERARLHAAHAAVLEAGTAGPAAPAAIAHHYTEADDAPKVLVWSIRAAEEAMRIQAPGEALQYLERALAAWPQVVDASDLAGISEGHAAIRAARAAALGGEPSRAIDWARRSIKLCDDEGDGSGSVHARAELVRRLVEVDHTGQAVQPAEEAVRLAESSGLDASTLAVAHVMLARALLSARRTDEARPQVERALLQARACRAPGLEVDALTTAAFLDEIAGDREAAADRLHTALRQARAEDDMAAELRVHYTLASLHYYNGDVSGALPVLDAAMTRVTESGLRWSDPGVELRLLNAVALYVSGELEAALQAADSPESRPPDVAAARLAAISCYAAVAMGTPDAGRRLIALRDSWEADPQVALVAGGCEADRLLWAGDFAGAVAIAEQAQTHLDGVEENMYGGLWLSALGLAALADQAASGRQRRDDASVADALEQGDVLLRRVDRIVEGGRGRPGDLGPEGRAWHARALAEHARLRGEPAVEEWQRALDAFGYGHVYEQARSRWRLAEASIATRDRAAATTHARAAAAAARQMGATPLERAVAETVTRARLDSKATTSADAVLTGREREVLALVAEGMTNREVGKRLFISEKTASVHLSNAMAKLNASSRTEAVTVAHRRGLLDVI